MGITIYIFEKTGSNFAVGLSLLLVLISHLLVAPIILKYSDSWDKKKTLIICNIISLFLLLLWSFNAQNLIFGYAIIFLNGIFSNIHQPVQQSLISVIVKKNALDKVNSLFGISGQINVIAGYACGAIILQYFGISNLLYLDSLTYGISAILIFLIKIPSLESAVEQKSLTFKYRPFFQKLWENGVMTYILFPFLIVSFAFGVNNGLAVGFSRTTLGLSIAKTGIVEAFCGVGFICGGIIVPRICRWDDEVIFYIASIFSTMFGVALGLSTNFTIAAFFWFLAGFINAFTFVKWRSFVQKRLEIKIQARTFSMILTLTSITQLISLGLSTYLADIYGPANLLVVFGVLSTSLLIIYGIWFFFFNRNYVTVQGFNNENISY